MNDDEQRHWKLWFERIIHVELCRHGVLKQGEWANKNNRPKINIWIDINQQKIFTVFIRRTCLICISRWGCTIFYIGPIKIFA